MSGHMKSQLLHQKHTKSHEIKPYPYPRSIETKPQTVSLVLAIALKHLDLTILQHGGWDGNPTKSSSRNMFGFLGNPKNPQHPVIPPQVWCFR